MPRNTREYLIRYADQAINDLERCLDRLKLISDTYANEGLVPLTTDQNVDITKKDNYQGRYGSQQQFCDLLAYQILQSHQALVNFRKTYM